MRNNSGITVSGGTVSVGAMAAGAGAIAVNDSAMGVQAETLQELSAQFRALTETLRSYDPGVSRSDLTVAELAEQEVLKDQPNKSSLLGYLQVLASGAGSISTIGTAVSALEKAVTSLL